MLILVESLIACMLGYAAAAMIIPINAVAIILWLVISFETCRARLRNKQPLRAAIGVKCTLIAALSVLAGAALYKPTKTVERILDDTVSLESAEMSLGQLDYYCTYHRQQFPIRTSLTLADADRNIVVVWPSKSLTLREFIGNIESQTPLRHRFNHCGNGWTLLHGGDCSFGLSIRDPELIGPPPRPKEIFEPDSYAPTETAITSEQSDKSSG